MNKLMVFYKIVQSKPSIIWVNNRFIEDRLSTDSFTEAYLKWKEHCSLSSNFKMIKIKDISVSINIGFTSKRNYQNDGIKFLNISNIEPFNFNLENVKYISKETHEDLKKSQLKSGDVLLTITGTVGDSVVVPSNFGEANISANIVALRLKKSFDSYYLSTFFNSTYGKLQTKGSSKSNVWSNLGVQQVREIEIPIPSPEIQKYIGDKVRKAEELRKEAKRLKKEAEEIINESLNIKQLDFLWEGSKVKFEWTSTEILTDRIDANYYEQKYVETINHIKKFSKKYITLNSIIDSIYTGKKPIYYEKGIEAYFVQSGNISSNFLELDNKEKVDLSKYNQILFGDLLIAKDGETIGKIAINLTNETIIINEHTYCVRLKDEYKCYSAYIYYFLTNKYINPLIRREATGSAQKGLNFTFTENIIIPILEEDRIMNLYNLEVRRCNNIYKSKQLIQEAKQDVEDLIEGNFDMSKVKTKS